MINSEAYNALVFEALRVGWPQAYRVDLFKYDYESLNGLSRGARFVWILRRLGTWICPPAWDMVPGARREASCRGTIEYYKDNINGPGAQKFYWWDGAKLKRVDIDKALALFDAERARLDHIEKMKKERDAA